MSRDRDMGPFKPVTGTYKPIPALPLRLIQLNEKAMMVYAADFSDRMFWLKIEPRSSWKEHLYKEWEHHPWEAIIVAGHHVRAKEFQELMVKEQSSKVKLWVFLAILALFFIWRNC